MSEFYYYITDYQVKEILNLLEPIKERFPQAAKRIEDIFISAPFDGMMI